MNNISAINKFSALSQADWLEKYNLNAKQNTTSQEVEPIAAIKSNIDVNDINYDNVNEYENKISANKIENSQEQTNKNKTENQTNQNNIENSQDTKPNGEPLSEEEQVTIEKLKTRDTEVRTHEQAHLAAAGDLATSGASFSYQQGPDGKQYAIGGEVNIDTGAADTPEETITKMQRVIAAAMAPAEPSGQDYSVAASARQLMSDMRTQINQNKQEENTVTTENNQNINENSTNKIETNQNNISNNPNQTINSQNNNELNQNINGTNQNKIPNYANLINNKLDIYQQNSKFASEQKGLYANFVA